MSNNKNCNQSPVCYDFQSCFFDARLHSSASRTRSAGEETAENNSKNLPKARGKTKKKKKKWCGHVISSSVVQDPG